MSDRNTTPAFAAPDYLPPRVTVNAQAVHVDASMFGKRNLSGDWLRVGADLFEPNGWLVTWKLQGGQEAFCYMRDQPDPRHFKNGAVIEQLFKKKGVL